MILAIVIAIAITLTAIKLNTNKVRMTIIVLGAFIISVQGMATYTFSKEPLRLYNAKVDEKLEEYQIDKSGLIIGKDNKIKNIRLTSEKTIDVSKYALINIAKGYDSDKAKVFLLNADLTIKNKAYKYLLLNNPPTNVKGYVVEIKAP